MASADDFRTVVLSLNGVVEGAHMGHPDFRANGRIFASLRADERAGTVKLAPEEQDALVHAHADAFAPAAGAWGRQGWTVVRLEAVGAAAMRSAVLLAWEAVMRLPPKRRR